MASEKQQLKDDVIPVSKAQIITYLRVLKHMEKELQKLLTK